MVNFQQLFARCAGRFFHWIPGQAGHDKSTVILSARTVILGTPVLNSIQ
ncbi:MAG: hypothetical protein RQ826_15560 [Xanthomonadales bacterium]|nr:hypothetical protein [Xanthomonadales bacterium]